MKLLCFIRLRYKDQLWSSLTHTHIHIHILKTHTNIYRKNLLTHMHLKYKHTHTHSKPFTLTHPPPPRSMYVCMLVSSLPTPISPPNLHTHPSYLSPIRGERWEAPSFLRWFVTCVTPSGQPPLPLPATISCTVNMYNGAGWCL